MPNIHKYSLGENTSKLFVEAIEMTVYASFLPLKDKLPYIKVAIRKTDTLKVFLQLIWEMKIWDDKTYLAISEKMNKAGQQLGGWHNNLVKENSPTK